MIRVNLNSYSCLYLSHMSEEKQEKRRRGRPTKYQPHMPDVAYKALVEGGTLAHVAVALDVDEHTVLAWIDRHPDFSTAVKRGLEQAKILWIDEKISKMPPACWIFSMKNIFGWRDKTETEVTGAGFMLIQNLGGKPKETTPDETDL